MLLNDTEITRLATGHGMITPFIPELIRRNGYDSRIISAGLSSFGYDLRADRTFQVFDEQSDYKEIDPKHITPSYMRTLDVHQSELYAGCEYVVIPPKTFALCHSVETVCLPNYVTALVTSKSTYARSGLQVTTTVGEAGWSGVYVLELFNALHLPLRVFINEGIAQILFIKGIADTSVSYADRNGKYMNQTGITLAKV